MTSETISKTMSKTIPKTLEQQIQEIRKNGLVYFPGLYTSQKCEEVKSKCARIMERFVDEGKPFFARYECQTIYNPFRHDPTLIDLLYHPTVDVLLKQLIDEDYVLIQTSILNRHIRPDLKTQDYKVPGNDWHTDSRYVGGQRLAAGFSYLVCVMFDDFTSINGATQYVPGSHLSREIPERQGNYSYQSFQGQAGTVVVMDSGVWHRSGESTDRDRWSMFSIYGPWFMKPYYRYWDMLGKEYGETLSPPLKRLLHYNCIPPFHEDERISTLSKEKY